MFSYFTDFNTSRMMGGPRTPQKTTKIDDFGSRIELSSSNPDRNDRTDLPHLFGIVNGPGKAIFGSKMRKLLKKYQFSIFWLQNRILGLIFGAVWGFPTSPDRFRRVLARKIKYFIGFLVLSGFSCSPLWSYHPACVVLCFLHEALFIQSRMSPRSIFPISRKPCRPTYA